MITNDAMDLVNEYMDAFEVPILIGRPKILMARIIEKVEMPDGVHGCWIWQGGDSGNGRGGGYGRISVGGKTMAVHRVAWEIIYGPLGGSQLDHKCNNRRCCNPLHLEPVTNRKNAKRREQRKVGGA